MKMTKENCSRRTTRTIKQQLDYMINYICTNKDMITPDKTNTVRELNNYNDKWNELSELLNASGMGPQKTVQQWKRVFVEYKTNTKRKYRENQADQARTGGGVKKTKPLNDTEEKLINALSKVVQEGANLPEAGIAFVAPQPLLQEQQIIDTIPENLININETQFLEFNIDNSENGIISSVSLTPPLQIFSSTASSLEQPPILALPEQETTPRAPPQQKQSKGALGKNVIKRPRSKRVAKLDQTMQQYENLLNQQNNMAQKLIDSLNNLRENPYKKRKLICVPNKTKFFP